MAHLFFHCSAPGELIVDHRGLAVADLAEARDHAAAVARFIMDGAFGVGDFSGWTIYVGDEDDEAVLVVPFAAATRPLH